MAVPPASTLVSTPVSASVAERLGPLWGKYGLNPARPVIGICSAIAAVVVAGVSLGIALVNLQSLHARDLSSVIVPGMLAAVCGALAIFERWTVRSLRGTWVEIYELGFRLSRTGVITAARWDEVVSLRERILYLPLQGRAISMTYHITLASGQAVRIDRALDHLHELGKVLQRMTTNALLPGALAAYTRGEPVRFGRFSVTQWGIADHNHNHHHGPSRDGRSADGGSQTLLWRDLRRISFAHGVLTISRSGARQPWARAKVAETPNIYLLTALISQVPRS